MKAIVQKLTIPNGKRVICMSDIHGSYDIFKALLEKVQFTDDDMLILLGDLFLKGEQPLETLHYIMELHKRPNVHILRGNCEWEGAPYLSRSDIDWMNGLPHIIESDDYIFVHGGIASENLDELDAWSCMKNDAFLEKGLVFSKYVVTGHWPVSNYCHKIPSCAPVISEDQKIICTDGGLVVRTIGQLNAFVIQDGEYAHDSLDALETVTIKKAQQARGGHYHATWQDRFVEVISEDGLFSLCRHIGSGNIVDHPTDTLWRDDQNRLCGCSYGLDYYLPLEAGETVSAVVQYGNRLLAKKGDIVGWVALT